MSDPQKQVLTIEETQRVIQDFSMLVSGPEHGVASNAQLLKLGVELMEFLASKGYPTSDYYITTRYRYGLSS